MRACAPALLSALALSGCYLSHGREAAPTEEVDAGCVPTAALDAGTIRPEKVDLLLMIDNSNSMGEEQASLAGALPDFIRALASGDVDFDGETDFTPVGSLHVGVVTSDMGVGGNIVPTCTRADFGDDGTLRTVGRTDLSDDCEAAYPPFLTYETDSEVTPEDFAAEVACVSTAGTGGCGFEQQLEAVLKALTPSSSPIRFFRNTPGHGDGENEGFLRPDSILTVLLVTDENDCSAEDPDLFNPSSPEYSATDLNLRCWAHGLMALHPVERYVDGLLALRPRRPGRLIFATISGVPPDLSGQREETLLADPRLTEVVDPVMTTRITPSCNTPGRGVAFPPRRLLEVGAGVRSRGGRTVHLSICQEDFRPAVATVLGEIGAAARPVCR